LRKSLGSRRSGIAQQFFLESFLMILGSLLLAFLLVIIFLHPFNQLAHKTFSLGSLANPVMMAIIAWDSSPAFILLFICLHSDP
jgi:putative ABC transport system permease protein